MSADQRVPVFAVVRLPCGVPEHGVAAGSTGTVLDVYDEPFLAYEVEVTDDGGRTVFVGAIPANEVELVSTPDQLA